MSFISPSPSGTRLGLTPSFENANQQEQPRDSSHDAILRLLDGAEDDATKDEDQWTESDISLTSQIAWLQRVKERYDMRVPFTRMLD